MIAIGSSSHDISACAPALKPAQMLRPDHIGRDAGWPLRSCAAPQERPSRSDAHRLRQGDIRLQACRRPMSGAHPAERPDVRSAGMTQPRCPLAAMASLTRNTPVRCHHVKGDQQGVRPRHECHRQMIPACNSLHSVCRPQGRARRLPKLAHGVETDGVTQRAPAAKRPRGPCSAVAVGNGPRLTTAPAARKRAICCGIWRQRVGGPSQPRQGQSLGGLFQNKTRSCVLQ